MTKDAAWQATSWRRLGAEFVVIVVGVLVELAVDAARDVRAERLRADSYVGQLRDT